MPENPNIDLSRPPFTLGEGTPAEVGAQIAQVYEAYDRLPPLSADLWHAAAQTLGLRPESLLYRAGHDLAAAIDSGVGMGLTEGYHNTRHYIEVLLNATQLVQRNNALASNGIILTTDESGKVLFAALAHDFHYELGGSGDEMGGATPYFREHISFSEAKAYLERHTVDPATIEEIGVMIYTTDVGSNSQAGAFLWAAHHYLFEGGKKPETTELLERVRPILDNARLARMAAIIRDADILSSAGLSQGYMKRQNDKLGAELGRPRNPHDTIAFLSFVVKNRFTTEAARFFQPNLEFFKQAAENDVKALG